jgi:hypothetical protein
MRVTSAAVCSDRKGNSTTLVVLKVIRVTPQKTLLLVQLQLLF